jgi:hypothetical protein
MITVQQNTTRTSKHKCDRSMEENTKKHPPRNSRADADNNVGSTVEQRENPSRTQNKVLSFSIEAILSAPHPKREFRNNGQNKHMQENPQIPDQTGTALNTLVEFTSTTLKDVSDERYKKKRKHGFYIFNLNL